MSLATTAGFLLVEALHIPFGYWATMATLLILQPSVSTTWPRGIGQVAGSVLGAVLAVLIGTAVRTPAGDFAGGVSPDRRHHGFAPRRLQPACCS